MPNPITAAPTKAMMARAGLILMALAAIGLALRWFPTATTAGFLFCIATAALLNTGDWLQKVRWPPKRVQMRWVRHMRRAIHPPPIASAGYSLVVAIAMFSLVTSIGFSLPSILAIGGAIAAVALSVAAAVDVGCRLRRVWKIRAVRFAIKWLTLFVAAVTVFGATVIANDLAHGVSRIDAKYLPDFVRLATAFVYPFVLATAIAAMLLVFLTIQYSLLLISMPMIFLGRMLVEPAIDARQEKAKLLLYRLWTGRKPPFKKRKWWLKIFDGVQYLLRPVGTMALAFLLVGVLTGAVTLIGTVADKLLAEVLVLIEYRAKSSCTGLPANARVAYLDDRLVSVAERSSSGYSFSIRKCEFGAANP